MTLQTAYRFDPNNSGTIQIWIPPKENKTTGEMSVGKWKNDAYYNSFSDAIRYGLIKREFLFIGNDMLKQLESLPEALELVTERIINALELGKKLK